MTFDWSVVTDNLPLLLQGAGVTVVLTVVTMALAVPGGLLLAGLRLSPSGAGARSPPPHSSSSSARRR